MALPSDMQIVPVILLKRDVDKLNALVKTRRWRSRSVLMRELIERALLALPECSANGANQTPTEQPANRAA